LNKLLPLIAFSILLLVPVGIQNAFAVTEDVKLTATDGQAGDQFGRLSLSGDTAIISSLGDDDNGSASGSVYIFEKISGTWTEVAKLLPSDGAAGDNFGTVSISGDTAIIGALNNDDNGFSSGSAYIFEKVAGTWTEVVKLIPADGFAGDAFGSSVSISGDTVIVSSAGDDDQGLNAGSAYIFEKISGTWTEVTELYASDAFAGDGFSNSGVSIDGDKAIVSGNANDDAGINSGSAYIFEKIAGVWTEVALLTASDAVSNDRFGSNPQISGDTAIMSAFPIPFGSKVSSVYVFEKISGVWIEVVELTASDTQADDQFGTLALSGDKFVVGAIRDDDNGLDSGSAYIFEKVAGVWTEVAKLTASDGQAGDVFGLSISMSGDTILIGSVNDDDNGINSGSAYIFEFASISEVTEIEIDIKPGSDPSSVDCTEKQPVPVAVFGSEGFDVSSIDLGSLQLNGVPVTEVHNKIHIEDKNKDGIPDAVLHLDRSQVCQATLDAPLKESVDVTLTGSTTGGETFEGIGDIRITGR